MKITISQLNPTIGDFYGNVMAITDACDYAVRDGANMIVFPELVVSGYYPQDLLLEHKFVSDNALALESIIDYSRKYVDLLIVLGTIRPNTGIGKALFNSLVLIKNGVLLKEYHKQLLPTYNIFDEKRHFEPGRDEACIIRHADRDIGFIICEDGWNDEADDYAANPIKTVASDDIDLLVSINASPSNLGKRSQRHVLMGAVAKKYNVPLLYVNSVGGQDSLVFDGQSFALDRLGNVVYEAPAFQEWTDTLEFNSEFKTLFIPDHPLTNKYEFYLQQIVMGLRDYTRRCGFEKVVVGCSGGIDSALTIALAVGALGASNVIAVTMPSEYSSYGSVSDSVTLCKNLGVKLYTHPIRVLTNQYKHQFCDSFDAPLKGVSLENLQARIRGTILMEYSNSFGALLLTTGNKSEVSVGYCTLYGDTNGGLSLIGDLYKTEVFDLSRYFNGYHDSEMIPNAIIDKAPSAELAPDQKDEDSLPPYELLDPILKLLIEGQMLDAVEHDECKAIVADLLATDEGQATYKRIKTLISRNEYKRRQAPPIIRVRARAFGFGRQMPLTAKY